VYFLAFRDIAKTSSDFINFGNTGSPIEMSDRSLDSSFNSREVASLIFSINFVYFRCKAFKSEDLSEGPVNSFSAITQEIII